MQRLLFVLISLLFCSSILAQHRCVHHEQREKMQKEHPELIQAAFSFFPAIILGIFHKRMNKEGAIPGIVVGMVTMIFYILKFKFGVFDGGKKAVGALKDSWWFGISP